MTSEAVVRSEGMRILRERLGLVEAEMFITLVRRGAFDYTEWQKNLWEGKSVEGLFKDASEFEKHQSP